MEHYRAYHYKVLLFEQEPSGRFKPPDAYVPHALAAVTTHDLPTLRGWWEEHDIDAARSARSVSERGVQDAGARDARVGAARADAGTGRAGSVALAAATSRCRRIPPALSRAMHAYLGLSRSNIAMMQIEDLIGMTDPVNVPGTDTSMPNWQRKVTQDTADIFARTDVQDILAAMNSARRGVNPNA